MDSNREALIGEGVYMPTLQKNRGKVRLFQRLTRVAYWVAGIPNRVTLPPFRLVQIGAAFWQSRALYAAASLGLADELGDGEKSTAQIAGALDLHEDHLYRLMRMLASLGVFTETDHRVFRNSKLSHCLRSDHPQGVRALVLMHNSPVMTRPWTEALEDCIRSGESPFVKVNGAELYEYMMGNEAFDRLFASAMDSVEALTGSEYLRDFDWSRFDRIIDVGGSKGSKSLAVLRLHPHMRATVFDRARVIETARPYWEGRVDPSVLARAEFVAGDMFDAIPVADSDRDIYMFTAVFHGLDDEGARAVLANLRRAFGRRRPTVLVVDAVAEPTNIDPTVASFDMQMLVGTRGRERTPEEWSSLFVSSGFDVEEVVDVRTFAKFIVLRLL
jgi:hypothetical protein